MLNYPLKFTPILKDKIWGGTKLVTQFNKNSNLKILGKVGKFLILKEMFQ